MSSHEAFLKNHPSYVEVSREGGSTDVILAGLLSKGLICGFAGLVPAVVGVILGDSHFPWSTKPHTCCARNGHSCHICSNGENFMYFGLGIFLCIIAVVLVVLSVKLALTKTIVRIDEMTGNFTIFNRTPWGEGKHVEFSREYAFPRIHRWASVDRKRGEVTGNYRFEVYPSRTGAKEKAIEVSNHRTADDVFVARDWNWERCDWVHRLILSIQGRPLPPKKSAQDEELELWQLAENPRDDFSDLDEDSPQEDDEEEYDEDDEDDEEEEDDDDSPRPLSLPGVSHSHM